MININYIKKYVLLEKLKKHHIDSYHHSKRVAQMSFRFALYMQFTFEKAIMIYNIALLHDIGKARVPVTILNKQYQLNELELSVMKKHVSLDWLNSEDDDLSKIIYLGHLHHERWDGKGYPYGLKFTEIPLESQIISICDAWDAMTNDRAYRKGMKKSYALDLLQEEKYCGQFDPVLLSDFISYMRKYKVFLKEYFLIREPN